MARITIEDCLARIPNRFELTLAATNRARQITAGSAPMVDADRDKPTVIALREMAAGKIGIEMLTKTGPTLPTTPSSASTPDRFQRRMSEIAEFTKHLGHYLPAPDVALVKRAFEFSESAHRGQFRKSGEPYITHPLAVASILSQWRLDAQGLAAALLHDVMEDTSVTKNELEKSFGKPVADMVDGVSKLDQIEFTSREEVQAESFRKMLLAMARDVRVILIKLADRLHNMRTLDAMAPAHRKRIARETLDIYAPIANRLGLNSLYLELQDLSFKHLNPMRYRILAGGDQGGARQPARGDEPPARRDPRGPRQGERAGGGERPREDDLLGLQEDAREALHVRAGVRHLRRAHPGRRQDQLLRGARRAARAVQAHPRQVQGLRRDSQGQRLPVAAHDAVRPVRHAARSADPHARHAPRRRGRRGRALALQDGRRARPRRGAARDVALAAEPARDPVRVRRLEGVPRAHQGRPLPRRDLRVHAEGQDHGAAARRDRGRLRLRRAHRHRPSLRRRRASTTSSCRCAPSSRTATTSRS